MTRLLIINFLRSKGLLWGLGLLLFTGLLGINNGKQFLDKYQENIAQTAHSQKESIARNVKYFPNEIGYSLYYIKFGLVNQMPNLAALSIGQRDVNPAIQSVTIRYLEEQKYNTDLLNPLYLLLGNLDFSFVLIYFFPLIIIAFCFSLLSEEKEDGTWSLVLTQSLNPQKLLSVKLFIRFLSVLAVLIILFLIGKFYLNIPFDVAFVAFVIVSILYIVFWFSLGWLVVSYQKSSSQNAIILLFSWLLLTVVVPAICTAIINYKLPVSESLETMLDGRDGYHKKWDMPKDSTVLKFYKHYPQFAAFTMPEEDFSWPFYYAMQQSGDDDAAEASALLQNKLRKREAWASSLGLVFPSMHTNLILSDISQSGMKNQLNFGDALVKFHENKRLYFYPKIFTNTAVKEENWDKFGVEYYQEKPIINWLKMLLPLLIMSGLCVVWANMKFINSL